jgi:hypothetical protein
MAAELGSSTGQNLNRTTGQPSRDLPPPGPQEVVVHI